MAAENVVNLREALPNSDVMFDVREDQEHGIFWDYRRYNQNIYS